MKVLLALMAAFVPTAGSGQVAGDASPLMNVPNYSTLATSLDSARLPLGKTPTMQRQRLTRASALRSEANALALEDGGVLSDVHLRYVQRKADGIMSGRH